jgi:hypothetical protein
MAALCKKYCVENEELRMQLEDQGFAKLQIELDLYSLGHSNADIPFLTWIAMRDSEIHIGARKPTELRFRMAVGSRGPCHCKPS